MAITFDAAAVATVRKAYARVTVEWGGSVLDSIEVTANSLNSIHDRVPVLLSQVADRVTVVPYKWMQYNNVLPLTEMRYAPSDAISAASNQFGWWGGDVSDGSGDFTTPQVLSVRFPSGPINALKVVGDSAYGEYPVDFTVQVWSDIVLSSITTITGNAAVTWDQAITAVPDATKIVLTITKWSATATCCKIAEFFTSITETYDGDEIMSLSILEEMEIKDATVPTGNISANELELELNNVDDKFFPGNTAAPYHAAIKKGRKIVVEIGLDVAGVGIVYKPMGTFWSGDWKLTELGTTAGTSARDRMERLRRATMAGSPVYYDQTVGYLAEQVLEEATGAMPDLTYYIDPVLYGTKYTIPIAWFEQGNFFDALRTLAQACLGRTFCDREDMIQVLGPVEYGAYEYEITADNYFDRAQPENSEDVINTMVVNTQPLTPATDQDVYKSSEYTMAAGEETEYKFSFKTAPAIDVVLAVEGTPDDDDVVTFAGSISSYDLNAWGGVATVACSAGGTFKITGTGTTYSVIGADVIERTDAQSVFEYGENRFELAKNPFIQTAELAEEICGGLLAAYKAPGKDTDLNWRGNPNIMLGTVILAPEYVKGAVSAKADFVVYKQKIDFDGTLRATLSGKKIRETVNTVLQDTDGSGYVMQDTDGAFPVLILQG